VEELRAREKDYVRQLEKLSYDLRGAGEELKVGLDRTKEGKRYADSLEEEMRQLKG
jgi:chromosome segregation ATPase